MLYDRKTLTQSYAEIFYLEALPFWVTPKSTAISYLSFTTWWLNKQDNNNNNKLWSSAINDEMGAYILISNNKPSKIY